MKGNDAAGVAARWIGSAIHNQSSQEETVSVYHETQLSSFVDQVFARLRKIEEQLAVLSEKAEVPYEAPSKSVPDEVIRLVEAGDRLGAIRKYRELTGCGAEEAKEAIAGL